MSMQLRTIAAIFLVAFAGTLLLNSRELLQWRSERTPRAQTSAPGALHAAIRTPSPPRSWRVASTAARPTLVGGALPRSASPAEIAASQSDPNSGPLLPVMLAIPSGAKELDLVNTSEEPLTITVFVADTQRGEFFLPPRAEQHLGTDAGIELEPGSQVTLRSPGYRELTETVR